MAAEEWIQQLLLLLLIITWLEIDAEIRSEFRYDTQGGRVRHRGRTGGSPDTIRYMNREVSQVWFPGVILKQLLLGEDLNGVFRMVQRFYTGPLIGLKSPL